MHGSSRAALMAFALSCSSAPVLADVVYTYQGAPLTVNIGPNQPDVALRIRLDFSDDGTTLLDWWSDVAGVGTIQEGDHVYPVETGNPWIQLSTDSSGNVVSWRFQVMTGYGEPESDWPSQFVFSDHFLYPDGYSYMYEDVYRTTSRDNYNPSFYANGEDVGTWTFSSALPDLAFTTVTPEPLTGSLMALGLLLVGFSCRSGRRPSSRSSA